MSWLKHAFASVAVTLGLPLLVMSGVVAVLAFLLLIGWLSLGLVLGFWWGTSWKC